MHYKVIRFPVLVFSSSHNLISDSVMEMRQAGQGESTAHAAATLFCPFQKHYLKTRRTLLFFEAMGRNEVSKIFNRNKLKKNTQNVT